jgi:UDP-N-acetyl-D-glucosamine dehydrogenase
MARGAARLAGLPGLALRALEPLSRMGRSQEHIGPNQPGARMSAVSSFRSVLEEKIATRTARVGVMGLGYVGLPLCVEFARAGFNVVGLDVVKEKIESLNGGRSYVEDIPSSSVAQIVNAKKFMATTDFSMIASLDAVIVCVPTPLRKTKDPDISYVVSAVKAIGKHCHKDMLVVLESTTYPGTTEEILLPELAAQGLEIGKTVFAAFSPERIDPSNKKWQLRNTPKVIGGATKRCTELACMLYSNACDTVVPVSSPRAAEMVKLLENTFRAINIGLANEFALMCEKLGLDVWEVVDAAATKPFGYMKFTPGPGLGGHCIPLDPLYLSWKMKERNYTARFIELADDVNSHMPDFVVHKAGNALNTQKKAINGSKILVLGVAYKKDVHDVRESPALDIIKHLEKLGAKVDYHDPYVATLAHEGLPKKSISEDLTPQAGGYDLVLICTDHSCVDYGKVVRDAGLILDCRNACKEVTDGKDKVIKL